MQRIYLDNNATTALDPVVFQAMQAEFSGPPANPSSLHWFGQRARGLLQKARQTVAHFFQAKYEEIIFTSGGTESVNLFLKGIKKEGHLISTAVEHSCVYKTLQSLEGSGVSVTYLPVNLWGAPLVEQIEAAIRPDTKAFVFSAANNETGVKIDIEAIADLAFKKKIPFFLDAVAYIGKESFTQHPGITAAALSGHKFHAPKGVGALYLQSHYKLSSLLTGGSQELMLRAGTENLAGILGLAKAIEILSLEQTAITTHLHDLRLHFEHGLQRSLPDLVIHGDGPRISNTSNIAFLGVDGETLLMHLDMAAVAASHGSACSSGAIEPSRVLIQMGVDRKIARSSLRFSLCRTQTREEIDQAIEIITHTVQLLRKLKS